MADNPPAPLIHIGYHKTGSSWLQNNIFNNDGFGFTDEYGLARHELVYEFVRPAPFTFNADRVAGDFTPWLQKAQARGLRLVLSHERFSGYPSSGGYDSKMIADRLKQIFPDAKILIIIREQQSLIRSMYSQHISDGGVESAHNFLRQPEPHLGRRPFFSRHFYEFHHLIGYYQSLFGEQNVLTLPFEMLHRQPQDFVDAIGSLCRHPKKPVGPVARVNERRPIFMQWLQRPLNAIFYNNELSPGALFHIHNFHKRYAKLTRFFRVLTPPPADRYFDAKLRKYFRTEIGTYYGDSNKLTEALTGLDLGKYGYALGRK